MSVFKVMHNKYNQMQDLENLVNYAVKEDHCMEGIYGAQGVLKGSAGDMYQQMYEVKNYYHKKNGRQAMHFILSFSKEEEKFIGLKEALEIGYAVANCFIGWQVVFGVHTNEEHLHIHFILNTVSYESGLKFQMGIPEFQRIEIWIGRLVSGYRKTLFSKYKTSEEMMNEFCSHIVHPIQYPCKVEL